MINEIKIKHSSGEYTVSIGENILGEALCKFFANKKYDRVFVVSDSNVFPLHGELLRKNLVRLGMNGKVFIFPAGEESKTLATVSQMYSSFSEANLTRHSVIIAFGGGVCGDMAGFAAATYLRGIGILQIPTTLLAQIDSSIGGKTGVDLESGKNLVGAFYQPAAVIADSYFLSTLPCRFFGDGMGEAIKYGCIADIAMLDSIAAGQFSRAEIIRQCVKIKADIVEADEHESGLRMILNYGHTLGHAVEKLGGFKRFSHGESVGIGMLYAARIGDRLGYPPVFDRIKSTLEAAGLPTDMDYPVTELIQAAGSDKKRSGDEISFVLLNGIGSAFVKKLPISELAELIR